MAQREKVPSVKWIGGGIYQIGRFWVATFANEGAERLAAYIQDLRKAWKEETDNFARAETEKLGKYAVAIYRKHFGEI